MSGELDIASRDLFAQASRTLVARCRDTRSPQAQLDVAALQFIDAAGFGVLVALSDRLSEAGAHLRTVNASSALRRLSTLLQLDETLGLRPLNPPARLVRTQPPDHSSRTPRPLPAVGSAARGGYLSRTGSPLSHTASLSWMATLARQLAAEDDLTVIWQHVVRAAVTHVEGADHAGITALSANKPFTPAATSNIVHAVDSRQYSSGEGPCLSTALHHERVVSVPDLATDSRWPTFTAAVADIAVGSMLSFRLYLDTAAGTEANGALNLYSSSPHAFTGQSVDDGAQLATHAAVAAAAAHRSEHLRHALRTRDTIGQAKGILMERYKVTAEQAFDHLVRASQHTQRKVADLAADITTTGEVTIE